MKYCIFVASTLEGNVGKKGNEKNSCCWEILVSKERANNGKNGFGVSSHEN